MKNQEGPTPAAAARVSEAMVNAMAPLIEKLGKEEGRDGLMLLGTSMVSAGVSLLRECLGDGETTRFIDQIRAELIKQPGFDPF